VVLSQVEKCYEISYEFCETDGPTAQEILQELSAFFNSLDAGETIVVCNSCPTPVTQLLMSQMSVCLLLSNFQRFFPAGMQHDLIRKC